MVESEDLLLRWAMRAILSLFSGKTSRGSERAILRSTPGRCPFAARVGSPREPNRFTSRVVLDGQAVCVAQAPLFHPHVVAQGRKLVAYGLRYAALDQKRVRGGGAYAGS